jgi:DNA-binding HxlR family transcriptional regulator
MIEKVYSHPELKNCPIDTTFKIIGQKWTVLILREMFRNQTQFNHILANIEGLTPRLFTQRMKTLQRLGIVERRIFSESHPKHEQFYEITVRLLTTSNQDNVDKEIASTTANEVWNTTQNIRDCVRVAKMAKSVEDVNWLVKSFLNKDI